MKFYKALFLSLLIAESLHAQEGALRAETAVPSATLQCGADRTAVYLPLLKDKTVGIFANQTSMVGPSHLVDTLIKLGVKIKVIFGPEHGFRGTADAGEKVGNNDIGDRQIRF